MTGSSGESTPARDASVTPTPPATQNEVTAASNVVPSPLAVGSRFVKQYYKTLSETPEKIFHFYQPSSVLSVGVGSIPTTPSTLESLSSELKDRFKPEDDTTSKLGDCLIRFELEHGAIDAQQSVDNAILLVVTGHTVYLKLDNESEVLARKAFVHTFFLRSIVAANNKVNYYVHNDVLRFLHQASEPTSVLVTKTAVEDSPEKIVTEDHAVDTLSDKTKPVNGQETTTKDKVNTSKAQLQTKLKTEKVDESPGGGVEESKEVMSEEADSVEDVIAVGETKVDAESSKQPMEEAVTKTPSAETQEVNKEQTKPIVEKKKDIYQKTTTDEKKTETNSKSGTTSTKSKVAAKAGSWASLVAGSASAPVSGTQPGTPSRSVAVAAAVPSPTAVKVSQPTLVPAPTKSSPPASTPTTVAITSPQVDTEKALPIIEKVAATNNAPKHETDSASVDAIEKTVTTKPTSASESNTVVSKEACRQKDPNPPQKLVGNDTYRRDPDSTLVIRNIPFETTDKDVMNIFEKFATDINGRVIRCTVNADRGIAFMDYDAPDPVLTAIAMHKETPFYLLDRKLHIYQKVVQPNQSQNSGNQNATKSSNRGGGRGFNNNKSSGGRGSDNGIDGEDAAQIGAAAGRGTLRNGGRGEASGRGGFRAPFRNQGEGRGGGGRSGRGGGR